MKKLIVTLVILISVASQLLAQSNIPNTINLQAIARDVNGNLVSNANIYVKLSFYGAQLPSPLLVEKVYLASTDALGQFQINVANASFGTTTGTVSDFSNIDWSTGNIYVKIEYQDNISPNFTVLDTIKAGTTFFAFASRTTERLRNIEISTTTPTTDQVLKFNGTQWSPSSFSMPSIQVFTNVGNFNYITPPGVKYIEVEMVGGGGGGGSTGTLMTSSGNGGNTTFGNSLLIANGGLGGGTNIMGGIGGNATIGSSLQGIAFKGATGNPGQNTSIANVYGTGGSGGSSPFGGAGAGAFDGTNGESAIANTGSGGGGGGSFGGINGGSGGGSGGYIKTLIINPSSNYSFTIGSGGLGAIG